MEISSGKVVSAFFHFLFMDTAKLQPYGDPGAGGGTTDKKKREIYLLAVCTPKTNRREDEENFLARKLLNKYVS